MTRTINVNNSQQKSEAAQVCTNGWWKYAMAGPHSGLPHSREQEPGSEGPKDMELSERPGQKVAQPVTPGWKCPNQEKPEPGSVTVGAGLGWCGAEETSSWGENVALACHVWIMAAPGDELRKTLNYYT